MKRLNSVGQTAQTISSEHFVFFNATGRYLGYASRLGSPRIVVPGTVAVSPTGRQWVALGSDGLGNACGWSFVSPYVDRPRPKRNQVEVSTTRKAEKILSSVDAFIEYYSDVKGRLPRSVVLRREQLSTVGALPGQLYKGIPLEAYS